MIFGVEEVKKECSLSSFPIELQAATTEGSYMHMGIMYFLLLMTKVGTMERGRDKTPTTFSIIVSASSMCSPPV